MEYNKIFKKLDDECKWQTPYILPNGEQTITDRNIKMSKKDIEKTKTIHSLDVRGKNVLDFGCGEGLYSFYLAENGANVLGVDIDKQRLKKATLIKDILGYDNVRFERGDILDTNYRSALPSVDLVVAWGFLHRIPDPFNAIIHLGSLCNSISFEWRAPALLSPIGFSGAVHNPKGVFEWNNIISKEDNNATEETSGCAEFWRLNPGFVKALLRRYEFSQFYSHKISKEYNVLRLPFNIWSYLSGYLFKNKITGWTPSMRIHLLAEKKLDLLKNYSCNCKKQLELAKWDGRISK